MLPAVMRWSLPGRAVVFVLSATSIWCLLAEVYGLCSMRLFTFAILIPATAVLVLMAIVDRIQSHQALSHGAGSGGSMAGGQLWRGVAIGAVAGFLAACAYDLFRIPFVMAAVDKVGPDWLRLPLFKVFPRFGAMILGEQFKIDTPDSQFSLAAHLVGWLYHFSNGITFGVMYMALVGDAGRRSWWWAVAMAAGLELAMLFTPYTSYFGIHLTTAFVIVTLSAHIVFGIVLGLTANWFTRRFQSAAAVCG